MEPSLRNKWISSSNSFYVYPAETTAGHKNEPKKSSDR
jgi:hypothetical protein